MSEAPPPLPRRGLNFHEWAAITSCLIWPLGSMVVRLLWMLNYMFADVPWVRSATEPVFQAIRSSCSGVGVLCAIVALAGLKRGRNVLIGAAALMGLMAAVSAAMGIWRPFRTSAVLQPKTATLTYPARSFLGARPQIF